jgi:hypothetical protein
MKFNLRDKAGKFKAMKINLLDGQRRGEIVFRRVFLLVTLYVIVALVLKLVTVKPEERIEVEEVEAIERIVWEGDQKVEYTKDGKKRYIYNDWDNYVPERKEKKEKVEEVVEVPGKGIVDDSVRQYIKSYGGKIDDGYLSLLREYCSEEALKVVVAISVAETSMGKNTTKQSNYFGWYPRGDVNYDPGVPEMAREICEGVQRSYMSIGENRGVTEAYTGRDRVDTWISNYLSARASM